MRKTTSISVICGLLLLSCMVDANTGAPMRPAPFAPTNIHLVYDYVTLEPELPKAWINKRIGELEKKVKEAAKQPGGSGVVYSYRQYQNYWRSRNKTKTAASGVAQYWNAGKNIAWVYGDRATFYNGRYVTTGNIYDTGLASSANKPDMVIVGHSESRLEEDIPYLGFVQPELTAFRVKNFTKRKTAQGFEEKRDTDNKKIKCIFTYNNRGLLTSIRLINAKNLVYQSYEFINHSNLSGCYYPRDITFRSYATYKDNHKRLHQIANSITTYHVRTADISTLGQAVYNVDYPRLGVWVQDQRPEFMVNGKGVAYKYINRHRTLTETSQLVALRKKGTNKNSFLNLLVYGIRVAAILAMLIIVGRAVFRLIQPAKK